MNAKVSATSVVSWLNVVVALISVGKTTVEEVLDIVRKLRGDGSEDLDTVEEQDAFLEQLRVEIAAAKAAAQAQAGS